MESKRDGITRRDFLDGVAISAAGLAAAAAAPHLTGAEAALAAHGYKPPQPLPPGYHPPTDTGLKGTPDDVVSQDDQDRRAAQPARRALARAAAPASTPGRTTTTKSPMTA